MSMLGEVKYCFPRFVLRVSPYGPSTSGDEPFYRHFEFSPEVGLLRCGKNAGRTEGGGYHPQA